MRKKQIIILVSLVTVACLIFSLMGIAAYFLLQPQTNVTVSNPQLSRKVYFCGIDRCRDSGEYGRMIFEDDINIWENPDPDRGGVQRRVSHGSEATIINERRVYEGPGGLWFELENGGWTNDLWVTDQICTSENLDEYSFTDCLVGEY